MVLVEVTVVNMVVLQEDMAIKVMLLIRIPLLVSSLRQPHMAYTLLVPIIMLPLIVTIG